MDNPSWLGCIGKELSMHLKKATLKEINDSMSKMISVISPGHSGSTLLDFVIGSIPGVFSTGEVTYLPWQIYRRTGGDPSVTKEEALAKQDVCSCLNTFRACDTWKTIIDRLSGAVGFDIYEDPFRFKMAIFANQRYIKPRECLGINCCFITYPFIIPPERLQNMYGESRL